MLCDSAPTHWQCRGVLSMAQLPTDAYTATGFVYKRLILSSPSAIFPSDYYMEFIRRTSTSLVIPSQVNLNAVRYDFQLLVPFAFASRTPPTLHRLLLLRAAVVHLLCASQTSASPPTCIVYTLDVHSEHLGGRPYLLLSYAGDVLGTIGGFPRFPTLTKRFAIRLFCPGTPGFLFILV